MSTYNSIRNLKHFLKKWFFLFVSSTEQKNCKINLITITHNWRVLGVAESAALHLWILLCLLPYFCLQFTLLAEFCLLYYTVFSPMINYKKQSYFFYQRQIMLITQTHLVSTMIISKFSCLNLSTPSWAITTGSISV